MENEKRFSYNDLKSILYELSTSENVGKNHLRKMLHGVHYLLEEFALGDFSHLNSMVTWCEVYMDIQNIINTKSINVQAHYQKMIPLAISYIIGALQYNTNDIKNYQYKLLQSIDRIMDNATLLTLKTIGKLHEDTIICLWDSVNSAVDFNTQYMAIKLISIILKFTNKEKQGHIIQKITSSKMSIPNNNILNNIIQESFHYGIFQSTIRNVLNEYNTNKMQENQKIYSMHCICLNFAICNYTFYKPLNSDLFWLDFNYGPSTLTCEGQFKSKINGNYETVQLCLSVKYLNLQSVILTVEFYEPVVVSKFLNELVELNKDTEITLKLTEMEAHRLRKNYSFFKHFNSNKNKNNNNIDDINDSSTSKKETDLKGKRTFFKENDVESTNKKSSNSEIDNSDHIPLKELECIINNNNNSEQMSTQKTVREKRKRFFQPLNEPLEVPHKNKRKRKEKTVRKEKKTETQTAENVLLNESSSRSKVKRCEISEQPVTKKMKGKQCDHNSTASIKTNNTNDDTLCKNRSETPVALEQSICSTILDQSYQLLQENIEKTIRTSHHKKSKKKSSGEKIKSSSSIKAYDIESATECTKDYNASTSIELCRSYVEADKQSLSPEAVNFRIQTVISNSESISQSLISHSQEESFITNNSIREDTLINEKESLECDRAQMDEVVLNPNNQRCKSVPKTLEIFQNINLLVQKNFEQSVLSSSLSSSELMNTNNSNNEGLTKNATNFNQSNSQIKFYLKQLYEITTHILNECGRQQKDILEVKRNVQQNIKRLEALLEKYNEKKKRFECFTEDMKYLLELLNINLKLQYKDEIQQK